MLHFCLKEYKMTAIEIHCWTKLVNFKWTSSKIWFTDSVEPIAHNNLKNWGYLPWIDQFSFLGVTLDVVAGGQFKVKIKIMVYKKLQVGKNQMQYS